MNLRQSTIPTPSLASPPSRRDVLRGLVAAALGLGAPRLPDAAEAKNKRRKKRRRKHRDAGPRCARSGEECDTRGNDCQASNCLTAPFTIEAIWESTANFATYLHVPPEDGATGPSPYIYNDCNQSNSACAEEYPFVCVDGGYEGPGTVIATIHELLPGVYEYWLQLPFGAAAGEAVLVLRDGDGRIVREWTSPPNATHPLTKAWRVFDVDGNGRVRSIDTTLNGFYDPATDVCPSTALGRRNRERAATGSRGRQP